MSLMLNASLGDFVMRAVTPGGIVVGERTLAASFLLMPDALHTDWPPASVDDLDEAAIDRILALAPEVVILGTGRRQRFPAPRVRAAFLTRRIGLEPMDNAAAARTYHVLASEGRRVLAAMLLPGENP